MSILLIHQNFLGQYKHLVPALARRGDRMVALTPKVTELKYWQGIEILPNKITGSSSKENHPWLRDLETKVIRAESCFMAARTLKQQGFSPDVILAHYGWGEPMFLKDVWPDARLGLYCELYYRQSEGDLGFDPEFSGTEKLATESLRLRNLNSALHFDIASAGISPTFFRPIRFHHYFSTRSRCCTTGSILRKCVPTLMPIW